MPMVALRSADMSTGSATLRRGWIAFVVVMSGGLLAGCLGADDRGEPHGGTIDVAIVDNPNTQDLARLTASLFTDKTDIKVRYTILDEGTLREITTRDVEASGRHFDVVMIGPYEAPQFGRDG